ncbi:hypothetical protein GCM10010129_83380 [Streptomyces fumigatiscleroticus]|nr:hypothetical protein GCM10010129_83380 [Streptomyces fumigatiscleroticus]
MRVGTVPPLAPAFQPRSGLREQIDQARAAHTTTVLPQVLSGGGGGVGKTQLAAALAHRALTAGTDLVVWVNAPPATDTAAAQTRRPDTRLGLAD